MTQIIHGNAVFETLAEEWDLLASQGMTDTPFQTLAYQQAWWQHLQPENADTKPSLTHLVWFVLLGLTFIVEALSQMIALQTGLVAYVIAIKRLGILITSLVGMIVYKVIFSWARLAGAVLIVVGSCIIYIS